jgi:GNAT superfamily N-acetyltransferase
MVVAGLAIERRCAPAGFPDSWNEYEAIAGRIVYSMPFGSNAAECWTHKSWGQHEMRGRGIADQLLSLALDEARQTKCERVWGEFRPYDATTRRHVEAFFKLRGFAVGAEPGTSGRELIMLSLPQEKSSHERRAS